MRRSACPVLGVLLAGPAVVRTAPAPATGAPLHLRAHPTVLS
jgi:hypothetical protein